ncbi:hypothetical protein ABZT48_43835 [Streptomyces avermitilis]|uniref:hypothetical protein n=1 Tax=Streptomyces avermitilis TaxID=33903 RepID=UPI0033A79238
MLYGYSVGSTVDRPEDHLLLLDLLDLHEEAIHCAYCWVLISSGAGRHGAWRDAHHPDPSCAGLCDLLRPGLFQRLQRGPLQHVRGLLARFDVTDDDPKDGSCPNGCGLRLPLEQAWLAAQQTSRP